MYTSGKLQRVPLKNNPPSPPTSITNYHTKVSQHMMLHYTESLHRRSSAGWLKLSSPEFPQLASVIKVDEGRQLARRAQKWSPAWGLLCSVHGERLHCLVAFTLQNMHCLELTLASALASFTFTGCWANHSWTFISILMLPTQTDYIVFSSIINPRSEYMITSI